ncbi:HpaII family restriction endonuclease [Sulfurimonas sp.]|uniref:HpaII family restriction endonuclease n=1 Tax=Sulfurimonas sp. TaxID=2022749 RepID=UPI003D107C0A
MALNKGEWSEIYTFLKLLGDGKLYAADANLNKIEDIYYPIINILKEEPSQNLEFHYGSVIKVYNQNKEEILALPIEEFQKQSLYLLEQIRSNKSKDGAFDIPEVIDFLESIKITKLKAKSKEKRDITLTVHDINTGLNPTLGFSIKSYLGNSSTIINASGKTNFLFKIENTENLIQTEIQRINALVNKRQKADIKTRVKELYKFGCKLVYNDMDDNNFKQNLTMIDSLFPNIMGEILKIYYSAEAITVKDLLNTVTTINPCNYDLSSQHPFYEYKLKSYLTDAALGMTPGTKWSGKYDANGGYIIVKEDGELVCYHIYNRNEFQEYLLNNTKLETPSSSRNGFGTIFEKDGEFYIKLNLQVRFL